METNPRLQHQKKISFEAQAKFEFETSIASSVSRDGIQTTITAGKYSGGSEPFLTDTILAASVLIRNNLSVLSNACLRLEFTKETKLEMVF